MGLVRYLEGGKNREEKKKEEKDDWVCPYLAGGHVANGPVGLDGFQLVQAPVEFLQRLHRQSGVRFICTGKNQLTSTFRRPTDYNSEDRFPVYHQHRAPHSTFLCWSDAWLFQYGIIGSRSISGVRVITDIQMCVCVCLSVCLSVSVCMCELCARACVCMCVCVCVCVIAKV